MAHKVTFIDSGREPKCPPDPAFPEGQDIDARLPWETRFCKVDLPYPAPRCGLMVIDCSTCKFRAALTVAGRPDDPRSVKLGCKDRGRSPWAN